MKIKTPIGVTCFISSSNMIRQRCGNPRCRCIFFLCKNNSQDVMFKVKCSKWKSFRGYCSFWSLTRYWHFTWSAHWFETESNLSSFVFVFFYFWFACLVGFLVESNFCWPLQSNVSQVVITSNGLGFVEGSLKRFILTAAGSAFSCCSNSTQKEKLQNYFFSIWNVNLLLSVSPQNILRKPLHYVSAL